MRLAPKQHIYSAAWQRPAFAPSSTADEWGKTLSAIAGTDRGGR
jgi:hypothetical protein